MRAGGLSGFRDDLSSARSTGSAVRKHKHVRNHQKARRLPKSFLGRQKLWRRPFPQVVFPKPVEPRMNRLKTWAAGESYSDVIIRLAIVTRS